ncbi:conserved hypothetical protein [Mesorhizobium escarrei]|uniref:Uncharacterized protein n=1 Tax=Mesorhizobium escarrei TaxID=666018 RepID=A0ABM9DT40_9HYPH|nr:conserved hypothetical protein [Mesorhizobium escarrei]
MVRPARRMLWSPTSLADRGAIWEVPWQGGQWLGSQVWLGSRGGEHRARSRWVLRVLPDALPTFNDETIEAIRVPDGRSVPLPTCR